MANLEAHSSIALEAAEGFTVARWRAGPEPRIVRGQWISPMDDLRLILDGNALPLDIAAEERLVQDRSRAAGLATPTTLPAATAPRDARRLIDVAAARLRRSSTRRRRPSPDHQLSLLSALVRLSGISRNTASDIAG